MRRGSGSATAELLVTASTTTSRVAADTLATSAASMMSSAPLQRNVHHTHACRPFAQSWVMHGAAGTLAGQNLERLRRRRPTPLRQHVMWQHAGDARHAVGARHVVGAVGLGVRVRSRRSPGGPGRLRAPCPAVHACACGRRRWRTCACMVVHAHAQLQTVVRGGVRGAAGVHRRDAHPGRDAS